MSNKFMLVVITSGVTIILVHIIINVMFSGLKEGLRKSIPNFFILFFMSVHFFKFWSLVK